MIRAECIRECTWQRRHWKVGDRYEGAATPPRHFRVEDDEPEQRPRKKKKDDEPEQKED